MQVTRKKYANGNSYERKYVNIEKRKLLLYFQRATDNVEVFSDLTLIHLNTHTHAYTR